MAKKDLSPGTKAGILQFKIIPAVIIVVAVVVSINLLRTAPEAERRPPQKRPTLVDVVSVEKTDEVVWVTGMGTVIPAREIEIRPRVNGQIIEVSDEFIPGGMFQVGDELLKIDDSDYELLVQSRLSDVALAKSNMDLEMGQQSVSQKEFELLGEDIEEGDSDLVLRKPQLAAAQASLARAEASLKQARLDLERTRVTSPFNAMVKARNIDLGVQVTPSNPLAVLTDTDKYWVRVVLPVEELRWITIPRPGMERMGSQARIYNENAWGKGVWREGRIIRLMNTLESQGRMAQLLVEVEDPLSLKPESAHLPPLILDSYLRIEIEGIQLNAIIALDRELVRNGSQVWIMDHNDKLEIRDIRITYSAPDKILISTGLEENERVISTYLTAPVIGMDLQENIAVMESKTVNNRNDTIAQRPPGL